MRVANEKPRIFQDGRDMTINVVVIVVLMLLSVGFTGMCSFNPGRPENGPVQEVDGKTFMGLEARAAGFPVRFPDMPEGWVNNSARRAVIGDKPAPVVGWVTPGEGYLQLTQTGADVAKAVKQVDEHPRELTRTENVAGREAAVYTSRERDVRDLWVVDLGDARLLITGAATDGEYKELVEKLVETPPIDVTPTP